MPVSPQDFNLWARMTGKKYPVTSEEKAAVAPEVHNFVRNIGKQGAVGEQEEQKQSSLAKNIAKGALIAGGVAAGVAAARDPRVQQAVRGFADTATQKASDFRESARGFAGTAAEKASNVRENVYSFLSNLGTPRVVDQDVVRASGDVTPNPIQQQQSAGATTPDSFEKYAQSLEAPVGTVSPSTGQSSTLFDYERRAIPYPGARERAREQFARSLEAPVGTVSPSTGQSSTLFNLYDSIVQKYPDPGVGKDVEFQPSQIGISSGKESLATEPLTGERYRVGGGQSLIGRGLEVTEPSARPQGQIIGKVGSLQSNRADQLINEYSQYLQGLVDREVNRETKVNKEIAALKEGAAMRVIDGLRAEAAQEKAIASNASQQTSAQEVAALVDPSVEYAQPEAQTDTTNSLFSSPTTPDNRVPKVSKVFDNSLKGQHDVATAIDNETDNASDVVSRVEEFINSQGSKTNPSRRQIRMSVDEFNEKYKNEFESSFPEELNPEIKSIPNVRSRRWESENPLVTGETIESLLTNEAPVIEQTMQGRQMRGGKFDEAGNITYYGPSSQYESADTGIKARQGSGQQYKQFAELSNAMSQMSDEELHSLLPVPGAQSSKIVSKQSAQQNRLAQEILRSRAINSLEKGYDLSPQQIDVLDRMEKSVAASENVRKQYRLERQGRPASTTGPEADVARAMSVLRTAMEVEPSESIAYPRSFYQAWGENKGEGIAKVDPTESGVDPRSLYQGWGENKGEEIVATSAPSVYTGAAAQAAGPVLFTGKSRANSVLRSNPITGTVNTPTGIYSTQANPDVLGTVYNVAGTPENRAIAQQVERNAQQFLSDAIASGLTLKQAGSSQEAIMPPNLGIRSNFIGPNQAASSYQLVKGVGLPGIEPSQRTGYARYIPGASASTPVSPFIGEMSGGTVQPSTELTNLPRYSDIGRLISNLSAGGRITRATQSPAFNFPSVGRMSRQQISGPLPATATSSGPYARLQPARTMAPLDLEAPVRTISVNPSTGLLEIQTTYDIGPRAREELAARNRTPIGPLTQSPGLPRVGNIVRKNIMDTSGSKVIGRQLTAEGKPITYTGPLTQSPGLPSIGTIVEKNIMDTSGSKVIGTQLTAEGYPITYPRMASKKAVPFYPGKYLMQQGNPRNAEMVKNVPTRPAWKLSPERPVIVTDPQTNEKQTIYLGGGPLKRYYA